MKTAALGLPNWSNQARCLTHGVVSVYRDAGKNNYQTVQLKLHTDPYHGSDLGFANVCGFEENQVCVLLITFILGGSLFYFTSIQYFRLF